ncbi:insulin receptor substrate 2a [Aplochiton taeniatus]
MASPPTSVSGGHLLSNNITNHVKKCGYLKKQKHGHRRFFVLKEHTDCFPARLEYYETEKKWRNRSAAKRVITLDSCLCVNKRADAKHKHLIALYTKDEYFAVAADNEQDQESWYEVLTDLIAEGKVYDSPASTSSLVGFEEANYGLMAPSTAVYKEVWQVNLKSKGLGQIKNLVGVYRLCLSSRTISFVKLNCDVAAVTLQLMNIRRCGHSDTFFFIEVGRSAVTGPGEFWMQAEDSVVAQNIHETILEAMKAMKELAEFRPRSKSQSASGSNPILVPTRRHLNNLPPSQTGLVSTATGLARRARTDSVSTVTPAAGSSPARRLTAPNRVRTASEGDGCAGRPVSMCLSVSARSPGSSSLGQLVRSHTVSSGRTCRMLEASSSSSPSSFHLPHGRSAPPPDDSPPSSVGSSLSVSPRRRGPPCAPDGNPAPRPFGGSGSLGDAGGFLSCDEYGSSPPGSRGLPLSRSDTPDSFSSTPPSHGHAPYMAMEAGPLAETAYRKRTYSLTTPRQQRVHAPQLCSASLDEYTLMKASAGRGGSPKVSPYPEDYGRVDIGSSASSSRAGSCGNLGDGGGYMPMMAQGGGAGRAEAASYMAMSPACVSAPKKILNPRVHSQWPISSGGGEGPSLEDGAYMKMFSSPHTALTPRHDDEEYVVMTPGRGTPPLRHHNNNSPPDCFLSPLSDESPSRPPASPQHQQESSQYMEMRSGCQGPPGADHYYTMQWGAPPPASSSPLAPSPLRQSHQPGSQRGRLGRPNRLYLDAVRTLPCMTEHPPPAAGPDEPHSPGEYINIDFSRSSSPTQSHSRGGGGGGGGGGAGGGAGRRAAPLSDYMNLQMGADTPAAGRLVALPESSTCPCSEEDGPYHPVREGCSDTEGPCERGKEDYTEMTFGLVTTPPQLVPHTTESSREMRLSPDDPRLSQRSPSLGVFLLGNPSSPTAGMADPDRSAKVIRADPQGRRRHSSETFPSTATVTPVCPSFAPNPRHPRQAPPVKRHSSVENVSSRSSEGSDDEAACGGSPMRREAGFPSGLNYMTFNLREGGRHLPPPPPPPPCDLVAFKTARSCKGGINGLLSTPYVCLGFTETATTAKGEGRVCVWASRRPPPQLKVRAGYVSGLHGDRHHS